MTDHTVWENPLTTRYASREMAALWGSQRKHGTWRRLWVALAEAEQELGLTKDDGKTPRITAAQIEQLRKQVDNIDFPKAEGYEKRFRHDVMAHIHTYGDACPEARDIIHLGATSCYVTDNTDLLLMREGLRLLRDRLVGVIDALARFAEKWRETPTLGFTHFQPAQLTTVGKRATLWLYDLILDLEDLEHRIAGLKFRGAKGTTGTQASFLTLFRGDHAKVRGLDRLVAKKMGFEDVYPVTGQTYSRKIDSQVLEALSGLAQSAHKFGTDLRLLQHRQELEEPFESEQVGSSAMAYKRNPMRSERMCGLARFVMSLPANTAETAAVQWLERTLDDSVNRRLTLPQAFLAADGIFRLYLNIAGGLVVNEEVIARNVARDLPFMATETLLMLAVQRGGDRQQLHEAIRQASHEAAARLKAGDDNDLFERLSRIPAFAALNLRENALPRNFVGRAPEQVTEFLQEVVRPIRQRFASLLGQGADVEV
jgi:adenylosuccinate lyase